jgi:hypothetical protein
MQNKAVVVGALGGIGRYIVENLVEAPDWRVAGLSRRKTTDGPRYRHIAVDLLDPEDTKRKLAELTDVTHVFYAAFQATPGSAADFASNTGPNREMLVNSVTAINRAAPRLKRVVLVTGTKYYGVHLGPLKTPMREPDPRPRRRNSPHRVADIVGDEKVATFIESKPHWPTARFFVGAEEPGYDILGGAVWMPVRKRHIHDFVTIQLRPVPAAVFADERATAIGRGQGVSDVKHQAKRRDMRAQSIVGRDRLGDEIGALRLNPGIDVLPVIAIRPAVESAVLH